MARSIESSARPTAVSWKEFTIDEKFSEHRTSKCSCSRVLRFNCHEMSNAPRGSLPSTFDVPAPMNDYVELHARSAFSFLRGASLPEQLAETAARLGLPAMALCDRDGVYGTPRFFSRARETGVRPIVGAELTLEDGAVLPVLVESRSGYQNLCRLLTRAHLRSEKGKAAVQWEELPEFAEGLVALTGDR